MRQAEDSLIRAGVEAARLDVELMMAEAAGVSRSSLLAALADPDEPALRSFEAMVIRRAAREPLAYILGRREFYSLDLDVTPSVLVPRPETETVVSVALEGLAKNPRADVLDIGTGSGAIAIAIAVNAPGAHVVAVDVSSAALEVARGNAARLGVSSRIDFCRADCFDAADKDRPLGMFDVIVSNPPYIPDPEIEKLEREVRDYEPRIALSGGFDGLEFYRKIATPALDHLKTDGSLIVEIGYNQYAEVTEILRDAGFERIDGRKDLAGIVRVVIASHKRR
jgi:release factor glutamine methyltransferase